MLPSFEERSVWIQLVSLVVVFAAYLAVSAVMLSKGVMLLPPYVAVFGVATILLVVILALGHTIAVMMGKPEPRDERDRLIAWRAEGNSSWLLAAGVFGAIAALVASVPTVWVAHLLLVSVFASEILKLALQIVSYRRGA